MKFHTWDEHQHGGRLICINVWRQLQTDNFFLVLSVVGSIFSHFVASRLTPLTLSCNGEPIKEIERWRFVWKRNSKIRNFLPQRRWPALSVILTSGYATYQSLDSLWNICGKPVTSQGQLKTLTMRGAYFFMSVCFILSFLSISCFVGVEKGFYVIKPWPLVYVKSQCFLRRGG